MNAIQDVTIAIGDYLVPDGWPHGIGGLLTAGDAYCDASYHGSQFRVQGNHSPEWPTLPVNLEISGRSLNYTKFSKLAVRVKIEWVQDGEPNTTSHGWIVLNS